VRAAERSRRRRQQREGGGNESMFSESLLAEMQADVQQRSQR
jgi:hypothetical protein